MRVSIDISEETSVDLKNAGISIDSSGISEISITAGEFEVVMTWEQLDGLYQALHEWLKPDEESR